MNAPIEEPDIGPALAELRRQHENPTEHELGLIDECLALTPTKRLERLVAWVDFIQKLRESAKASGADVSA